MPRRKTSVKIKSLGAVDIHFHGAFGIDVMTASPAELDRLARLLHAQGIAAFCPTTLSVPWDELLESVHRLGHWISGRKRAPATDLSMPLGIHLEGPYLHPGACGAHPKNAIRKFDPHELEKLWRTSCEQLKILTIAPERLSLGQLKQLGAWAQKRNVILSLGHSQATEKQARLAFEHGFTSVTHGWNALGFHPRTPGAMGAALGRSGVAIELILDQVHVSPTVMRWTQKLHPHGLCYVSDCAPAAATRGGRWHSFGRLKIRLKDGACRLKGDHLAGGGTLLTHAWTRWIETEARVLNVPVIDLLRRQMRNLATEPLKALRLEPSRLKLSTVEWSIDATGKVSFRTLPS